MPDAPTPPPTIIYAGGGTGGHLFPALAIAHHARVLCPGVRALFLCSRRPLDAEILRAARVQGEPVRFIPIPAQPVSLRPRALAKFVWNWGGAVRAARGAIAAERAAGPVVVAALGGFVAAPAAQAARASKTPLLLVNLDAIPGKANRWISRHASRTLTAAPLASPRPWEPIAPIVRPAAAATQSAGDARQALGLSPGTPTLLVTGASQGAGSMNKFMQRFAAANAGALRGWQVIHQTGKSDVEETKGAYQSAGVRAEVREFIADMGVAWGAATIALSRAGAGSVAEVWANAVPTIFMPYPYHKDQHQKHNAKTLVDSGGAALAADLIDPDANLRTIGPVLASWLADAPGTERRRSALKALGPADGAAQAARALIELAAKGRR